MGGLKADGKTDRDEIPATGKYDPIPTARFCVCNRQMGIDKLHLCSKCSIQRRLMP